MTLAAHLRAASRSPRLAPGLAAVAAVVAVVEQAHGLSTGWYLISASWLRAALVLACATAVLVGVARPRLVSRAPRMGLLGVLVGVEMPWALLGAPASGSAWLQLFAGIVAAAALGLHLWGDGPAEVDAIGPVVLAPKARERAAAAEPAPAAVAAGWYADPVDGAWLRWWDGSLWTQDRHPRTS